MGFGSRVTRRPDSLICHDIMQADNAVERRLLVMKRTVTVRMPDELHDRCRKAAKDRKVSMNELFLESLTAMLDSAEREGSLRGFRKSRLRIGCILRP